MQRFELRPDTNHNRAVAFGKGAILDGLDCIAVCLGDGADGREFLGTGIKIGWERGDGGREAVLREVARQCRLTRVVHSALKAHFSQHHLGMTHKIFVDGD